VTEIPTALDQQLAPLRTRNRELVAQFEAGLPKASDFEASARALTDAALAQCAALERDIDAL
jgi:hypothetical protein